MEQSPELYREYDLTDNHCRHFVGKEDGGDGIYCGLIDCEVYHEQSIKSIKSMKQIQGFLLC